MQELKSDFVEMNYEDRILRVRFFDGEHIDLVKMRQFIAMGQELVQGEHFVSISVAENGVSWSKEARDYSANSTNKQIAAALVSQNPVLRVIANFFLKVNKPVYPTKFFGNVLQAEEWVNKMLVKYDEEVLEMVG